MCTQLQYETISTSLGYNFSFPKLEWVQFWRNILWLHIFMHTFENPLVEMCAWICVIN